VVFLNPISKAMRSSSLTVCAIALLSLVAFAAAQPALLVSTPLGSVQGKQYGATRAFYGIPFAKPPVGNLRFRPAQPVAAWNQTLQATSFGNACLQPGMATSSEDCLYMNIWAPLNSNSTSNLPVMFWVHGGSFASGTGNDYDGYKLATQGNVIVVSVNYRLGPLGSFTLDEIKKEDPAWPSYGGVVYLTDVLQALRFVQQNIGSFGGDKTRVTVFGESAGSLTLCLIMATTASPAPVNTFTTGLYKRVILQSGSCVGTWTTDFLSRGLEMSAVIMKKVGAVNLATLRSISGPDFMARAGVLWIARVAVDDYLLKQFPLHSLLDGKWTFPHDGSIVVGYNTMDTLAGPPFNSYDPKPKTYGEYAVNINSFFRIPKEVSDILNLYPGSLNTSNSATYLTMNRDVCVRCPSLNIADLLRSKATPVGSVAGSTFSIYVYEYGYTGGNSNYPLGAGHAAELSQLFDPKQFFAFPYDALISNAMIAYWTNFATTGIPYSYELTSIAWPEYKSGDGLKYLAINQPMTVKSQQANKDERCDYWNGQNNNQNNNIVQFPSPSYTHQLQYCIQQFIIVAELPQTYLIEASAASASPAFTLASIAAVMLSVVVLML